MPANQGLPWLSYMITFLRRLLDAGYITVDTRNAGMLVRTVSGMVKTTPDVTFITEKGRSFVAELGIDEL